MWLCPRRRRSSCEWWPAIAPTRVGFAVGPGRRAALPGVLKGGRARAGGLRGELDCQRAARAGRDLTEAPVGPDEVVTRVRAAERQARDRQWRVAVVADRQWLRRADRLLRLGARESHAAKRPKGQRRSQRRDGHRPRSGARGLESRSGRSETRPPATAPATRSETPVPSDSDRRRERRRVSIVICKQADPRGTQPRLRFGNPVAAELTAPRWH